MNIIWQDILARLRTKRRYGEPAGRRRKLFVIFLALFISLPPFTFQILPSFSSDVKNKKISYKEIRERKHSKNKPGLKNQVVTSGLVLNLDATNIDNMNAQAGPTTSTTTWTDLSGLGNNGTLMNFANLNPPASDSGWDTVSTNGLNVPALRVDGTNDFVDVAHNASLSLTTFTISAFVNPSRSNLNGNNVILCKRQYNYLLYFNGSNNNTPRLWNDSLTPRFVDAVTPIPANAWSQVTATYDGTTRKIYINGTLSNSDTPTGTITQNTNSVTVGSDGNGGYPFPGSIGNARIYNRALSDDEVRQSYLAEASRFQQVITPPRPTITSVTIDGISQPTTSTSFRITNGQALKVSLYTMDSTGNQTTLTCNPSVGTFSAYSGASPSEANGDFIFTPTATNVGMTSTITVSATSYSGNGASTSTASALAFTVSVVCGNDAGCTTNGQSCNLQTGACDTRCVYSPIYFSMDMLCTAALIPPTPSASTSQPANNSVQTSTPTVTPTDTTSAVTATPNITNSGSTNTNSQGINIPLPQINTAPASINTNIPKPFIDISMHGIVQPEIPKTTGIDISTFKPQNVKPDSAPYIDVSKMK